MTIRQSPPPTYFTSLSLENVRCFAGTQRLDLTDGAGRPARWTLLLGENGIGKTTMLQCLAWMRGVPQGGGETQTSGAAQGPEAFRSGIVGPALLDEENETLAGLHRIGKSSTSVLDATMSVGVPLDAGARGRRRPTVLKTNLVMTFEGAQLKDVQPAQIDIEAELGGVFYEPFVVAYGANRQLGVQNLATGDLDDPIAARLSGPTELYDVEDILTGLDYAAQSRGPSSRDAKTLKRFCTTLAKILPGDFGPADVEIRPPDLLTSGKRGGVHLRTFSGRVPLAKLSLGYQTTLAWTADLAWRLTKRYPTSANPLAEPAVVLIDEIDLHLHPQWQVRIVDSLSSVFEQTQFVATAHSPLLVQVAETANLVLLRRNEESVEVVNDPEVVRGWRVDQILTSELFGIPATRNPETERRFHRRLELVTKAKRSAREEAELRELDALLAALPTADDPEDQKAMDLIRRAAALL